MKRTKIILITLGLAAAFTAHAQTKGDGVGDEEVTVINEFASTIQDANKENLPINVPEIEEPKPKYTYTLPARDFKDMKFEPNVLKPLGMSAEKLEKFNTSYIKAGFGSQIMPLAQLAYNDNRSKNVKFGLYYDHLSAMDYKRKSQRFSDDLVGVYAKFTPKKLEIGTGFEFHNIRNHFYSYLDSVERRNKDIRQVLRSYDANVYIKNGQKNDLEIDFKQDLRFNYFTQKDSLTKANEFYIGGRTDFSKTFKQYHAIIASFDFDISQLKNLSTLQRNLFIVSAGYKFDNDDWYAKATGGIAVDGSKVYPVADLKIEKRLYQHTIIAYGGYLLAYKKNSYKTLAETNNFLISNPEVRNTLNGDVFAGLKGTIGRFSYNAAFHFNDMNNMPLYLNDTLDIRRFYVIYDKARIFGVHAEAGYNIKENFRLLVMADYYNYNLKTQNRAWHEPEFRATLRATYNLKNKFIFGLDVYGITNTYAKLPGGFITKIKGTADINLSVDYIFNKHLSFFAMVNNLAHQKYQRFNGYPSFGINGMVGAKFSF